MKKEVRIVLAAECNFSHLAEEEIETVCKYEYMRESQELRDKVTIGPYLNLLSSSCKADCPKQYLISKGPNATADAYRIRCPRCNTFVSLPCDDCDWVEELVKELNLSASGKKVSTEWPVPPSFFYRETLTHGEVYRLVLALKEAGFPKPWNTLKEDARKKLIRAISEREKERKISYPPVVIEEASVERDWERELEQREPSKLVRPVWRLVPCEPELLRRGQKSNRRNSYGFIRIDESYNETEAGQAFKAWFRQRYGKTKGGNRERWKAKLNDLVVMRLWKRFSARDDAIKRVEHVAKFTTAGFKGCKDWWEGRCYGDYKMSPAANEEMSRARADALEFFQSLFPGERPLSWREPESS